MRRRELIAATALLLLLPGRVHASLLSAEAEDALAKYIALFVIFVVPVVLITLFWMVHILPEKIAHKRHHPAVRGDSHALSALARVRRPAVAAGLDLGVLEAGDAQARLWYGHGRAR